MKTGIYKITVRNDSYVGSATDTFRRRFKRHENLLRNNTHFNKNLQAKYNELKSFDEFIFEVIEVCNRDECLFRETMYIEQLKPTMNIIKVGIAPNMNKVHSRETIEKISNREPWNKGILRTEEEKKLMSETKRAVNLNLTKEEYLEKMRRNMNSKSFLGKHHTEEVKSFLKESNRNKYPFVCNETGKIFECMLDCAREMGLNQGHIQEVLVKKRRSEKGYTFNYLNEEFVLSELSKPKFKDNFGNFFKTASEACRYHGLSISHPSYHFSRYGKIMIGDVEIWKV